MVSSLYPRPTLARIAGATSQPNHRFTVNSCNLCTTSPSLSLSEGGPGVRLTLVHLSRGWLQHRGNSAGASGTAGIAPPPVPTPTSSPPSSPSAEQTQQQQVGRIAV
jgi:hypothetical protein